MSLESIKDELQAFQDKVNFEWRVATLQYYLSIIIHRENLNE